MANRVTWEYAFQRRHSNVTKLDEAARQEPQSLRSAVVYSGIFTAHILTSHTQLEWSHELHGDGTCSDLGS
jgi:hypothetical protein